MITRVSSEFKYGRTRTSATALVSLGAYALFLAACTRTVAPPSTVASPPPAQKALVPGVHPTFGTSMPPWRRPINVLGGANAAGLRSGPKTDTARLYLCHLDVFIEGKRTRVPAQLGIDGGYASELQTRNASGTIDVDPASAGSRYVLGQLFIEWDVRLGPGYIGGLATDAAHPLAAYVNGVRFSGDPAQIELAPHREIALVYGTPPPRIPQSYMFPARS